MQGWVYCPGPPGDLYYEMSRARVERPPRAADRSDCRNAVFLIDGEGVWAGAKRRGLCCRFSLKTVIGPIFFEFIQRKGG